jgi:hypothetical protein
MRRKSALLALAFAFSLTAPMRSLAQDAGVSGIPHGPGSIGGVNNTINDPSGIGNAAKLPPLPSPSTAPSVVPATPPVVSSRSLPVPVVTTGGSQRIAVYSRRQRHRLDVPTAVRPGDKRLDQQFSICKGC